MSVAGKDLTFAQLTAAPDVGFWQELMRRKLDVLRLDSSPIEVRGYFEAPSGNAVGEKCFFSAVSFDEAPAFPAGSSRVRGELKNFNSVDEFRNYLKSEARSERVAQVAQALRDDIVSGAALEDPEKLRPLFIVVFADLKKYVFSYTMAYPVLAPPTNWSLKEAPCNAVGAPDGLLLEDLRSVAAQLADEPALAAAGVFLLRRAGATWSLRPLAELANAAAADDDVVAFVDPSASLESFGWPLRNLLMAVAHHRPGLRRFLAFRDPYLHRSDAASAAAAAAAAAAAQPRSRWLLVEAAGEVAAGVLASPPPAEARFAAWSKINSVDLTVFLDKKRMAADAVDLNVKLMKWRLLPDLEPERMKETRFLLLGAGTLGCSMARVLMGWGVRKMTFLDSGKVQLSNPVRQSLFTHQDASEGRSKAQAARDAIMAVMPDAEVEAVDMEIPMPGHPHQSPEALEKAIQRLQSLVHAHDVVCMLTDSRESRWLPSLLVAAKQDRSPPAPGAADFAPPPRQSSAPLGITIALGFDSFLVGRQSFRNSSSACYFCNDLTAPADSLAFRTLDQQCTVTRPGLSSIACGIAAELVAALTQHKEGFGASCSLAAGSSSASAAGQSLLGAVPHQIRGYLADFRLAPAETEPFAQCICCSPGVLGRYKAEGVRFVQRVISDSSELEQVSGLAAMKAKSREEDVLSFDDFDEAD